MSVRPTLRVVAVLLAAGWVMAGAGRAMAHPLGNFTLNAAAAVTVSPGELRIDYALDLAEIPTFQLMPSIDVDGDGATEAELQAWASTRSEELLKGISVRVGGESLPLSAGDARASLSPGQGGLDILRLDAVFTGQLRREGSVVVSDRNDPGRLGWREIVVVGANGLAVTSSSVPASSSSDHLRAYPDDFLSSPPRIREARFSFGPGTSSVVGVAAAGSDGTPQTEPSALSRLVGSRSLNLPLILLALLIAFGIGALHALAPGHGKTVTAAFVAGSAARPRDAVRVGVSIAVMHTATVISLGLILVLVAREFPAERLYPWLGIVAGGAAMLLGTALLVGRIRHRHSHRSGHTHTHPSADAVSRPGLAALALSGGLLPSPTAVVVLLASFTLDRAVFGLGLVVAFGAGLAASIIAVALLTMRARDLALKRLPARLTGAVPIAGAGAIAAMGAVLAVRAVSQL